MSRLFLVTYIPLASNAIGRENARRFDLPPFIDGSIRREPDLEHARPAISCLCRGGNFAPRLRPNDYVVYFTCKGRYEPDDAAGGQHWRLIAVLRVDLRFESHAEAARWYRSHGLPLPSNCMVPGNGPRPIAHSNGGRLRCTTKFVGHRWERQYLARSTRYPSLVVCTKQHVDYSWGAPRWHEGDFLAVLPKMPGTRNPGALDIKYLRPILRRAGIAAPPSSP